MIKMNFGILLFCLTHQAVASSALFKPNEMSVPAVECKLTSEEFPLSIFSVYFMTDEKLHKLDPKTQLVKTSAFVLEGRQMDELTMIQVHDVPTEYSKTFENFSATFVHPIPFARDAYFSVEIKIKIDAAKKKGKGTYTLVMGSGPDEKMQGEYDCRIPRGLK